jgi:diaminopimelate decarboxylase
MRDRWERFLSQDRRGMLMIEGVPVDTIVAKYGTPIYVYVESEIRMRAQRFKKVFGPEIGFQFAVKCNSNLEILRILREEGFELDCSSVGELILGLLADFKPKQLSFTNLYKNEQDLFFATKMGVQSITADSIEDLEQIAKTAKKLKRHIDVAIRVNPMLEIGHYSTRDNKYGIPIGYIDRAIELARKSPFVDLQGFHFFGGYVHETRVYKAAARIMVKLVRRCQDRGIKIKSLSLGGGFPAAVGDEEAFPIEDMKGFPQWFRGLLQRNAIDHPLRLVFEPGKSIVLNAGIGLTKVVSKKRLGLKKRMVVVDSSAYNFVPDALVQEGLHYDLLPASKMNSPRIHKLTVGGNTCDAWEIISRDLHMPKLRAGDLLAIMDVGAYAQVMASNFNTIKRAAIVLIHPDGSTKLIRRRDRYSEMFAPELDVLKLAGPDELERYNNLYRVNVDNYWRGQGKKKGKNGNGNGNGNPLKKKFKELEGMEAR